MSARIVFFFVLFLGSKSVYAHPAVFIKLIAQEALPSQSNSTTFKPIKGLKRTAEPVTFAVPLHNDSNLLLKEQITLIGADLFQFRILRKWPNEKIQWLLVDTQVSLDANQLTESMFLTAGKSILSEKVLTQSTDDSILVNTGDAQFEIRKKGFNLFNKVTVQGKTIVSPSSLSGVVLKDSNGVSFRSNFDPSPDVSVEEDGPLRCVVKAKGQLVSKEGKAFLGYTIRMHFYKGKERVRLFFTLRNASKKLLSNAIFQSLELVLKSDLQKPSFVASSHDGEVKGDALGTNAKLRVFHGENNFPSIRENGFTREVWPSGISGYQTTLDGKVLKQGTREQPNRLFYAQISQSGSGAVTVGTRFAAGYWPQGLGLDGDGTVRVGVFPSGNDKPYVIRFNGHVTREHMFHFSSKQVSPRTPFFKFQYPVIIRPLDVDWFNQIEIWNERLVSLKEESDFHKSLKFPNDKHEQSTNNRRPTFAVVRHRDWSQARRPSSYSPAAFALYNFLRRKDASAGEYYLMAEQMMLYNADHAYHSDDFNVAKFADEVPKLAAQNGTLKDYFSLPNAEKLPKVSTLWSGSYRYASLFQPWYFLFGDARFRDTYLDWGEYQQLKTESDTASKLAHNLRNLTDLFEFTRNPIYQDLVWKLYDKEVMQKIAVKGTSGGLDRKRGFFIANSEALSTQRVVRIHEQSGALIRAAVALESKAGGTPQQASQARDLIDALSRFVADQAYLSYGTKIGDFGFPFALAIDQKITDLRTSKEWNKGLEEAYLAVHYAYIMSKDDGYLKLGEKLLQITAENPQKSKLFGDHPSRQKLQYLIENPLLFSTWRNLPLRVQNLGNGRYRLSWVSPYNAMNYWFKMSTKPLVDSLGYRSTQGDFQSDPSKFTPFFAARYINQQPEIKDPGFQQAMFVNVPDPTKKYYFSARFLSTDPRKAPTKPFAEPVEEQTTNDSSTTSDGGGPEQPPGQEKRLGDSPKTSSDSNDQEPKVGCGCSSNSNVSWFFLLYLFLWGGILFRRRRTRRSLR